MNSHPPIRILVVDDEPALCEITKEFLELSNYLKVNMAFSVSEARVALSRDRYDAIVSDYQMPEEDGLQFLISLRTAGDRTPFILFTGKGREEVVIAALNQGADSYLQKGGSPGPQYIELEHRIKGLVQRYRAVEALRESEIEFRFIFEESPDAAFIISIEAIVLNCNRAAVEMLGRPKGDIIGVNLVDLNIFSAEDICRFQQSTGVKTDGSVSPPIVHKVHHHDGSIRWVQSRASGVMKGGKFHAFQIIARDITDIKNAEIKEKESLERMRLKLDSVLSPGKGIEKEELSNIIDAPEIQSMMDDFFSLTNILFAILDLKGNILVANGWQDICTKFHRVHPETKKNCTESDLHLTNELKPGEYRLYKCKNGMWDIITPLFIGQVHRGNLYFGQFFFDDEVLDTKFFIAQAKKYGFNQEEYLAALAKVPRLSRERVDQLMHFYTKIAVMVSNLSYSNLKLARVLVDNERAEASLRRSEERYRSYLEHSPVAFFVAGETDRCLDVNNAACEMLGRSREELLDTNVFNVVFPEDEQRALRTHQELQRTGHFSKVTRLMKKGGRARKVLLEAVLLPSGESIAFATDIESNLLTEGALRESEARLRSLVRTIPDMIWLKDKDGVFLNCNASFERFFGLVEADIVGKTDHDIVDHELADFFQGNDRMAMAADVPTSNEEWVTSIDGHRTLLETIKTPMYNDQGALIGVLGIGRDITESRQIEEAIRSNEELLSFITNNMKEYVWLLDMQMKPNWISPSVLKANGSTAEEMAAQPQDRSMTPQSFKRYSSAMKAMLAPENLNDPTKELFFADEQEFVRKDGNTQWNEVTYTVLRDNIGLPTGILAVGRDITERRRTEHALNEANRKFNLLSNITRHDINNQLIILAGNLALLRIKQHDQSSNALLQRSEDAAERISAMIQFTKVYEDTGVLAPAWQNVREMIHGASEGVNIEKIRIVNDVLENSEVLADPLIVKVFHNLIDNAVRYGEDITTIHFSVEVIDGAHTIVCEDDGVGISLEMKEMLFKRGFGKNHGLGLFLSREILAITSITIDEVGEPGHGAKFIIKVPPSGFRTT